MLESYMRFIIVLLILFKYLKNSPDGPVAKIRLQNREPRVPFLVRELSPMPQLIPVTAK